MTLKSFEDVDYMIKQVQRYPKSQKYSYRIKNFKIEDQTTSLIECKSSEDDFLTWNYDTLNEAKFALKKLAGIKCRVKYEYWPYEAEEFIDECSAGDIYWAFLGYGKWNG